MYDEETEEILCSAEMMELATNKPEAARQGLDEHLAEALTCCICMCIAEKPVTRRGGVQDDGATRTCCRCVSTTCHECMAKSMKFGCPTCRAPVHSVVENAAVASAIRVLKYKCWHCSDVAGLSVHELEEHLRNRHAEEERERASVRVLKRMYLPLLERLEAHEKMAELMRESLLLLRATPNGRRGQRAARAARAARADRAGRDGSSTSSAEECGDPIEEWSPIRGAARSRSRPSR